MDSWMSGLQMTAGILQKKNMQYTFRTVAAQIFRCIGAISIHIYVVPNTEFASAVQKISECKIFIIPRQAFGI